MGSVLEDFGLEEKDDDDDDESDQKFASLNVNQISKNSKTQEKKRSNIQVDQVIDLVIGYMEIVKRNFK